MKLKMELLSDALPGSGEGLAGIIDADVNYDDCGLPYIPAKRLKGILREAAFDLRDVNKLTDAQVSALFGKTGQERGMGFRLSDGYLPDYPQLRAFLKECSKNKPCQKEYGSVFHRQAVLDFYSYTRSQTAIEDEGESVGVAKETSLRTFRVLKKGLTFECECESLSKDDLENLNLICAVTRRFGSSRTRGLGAIALHCVDLAAQNNDDDDQNTFQNDETCVCRLDIQTHGQLLVTNEVGNDQVSEAYLPGSFLLGALADAYMQHNHLKNENAHKDAQFREMFLHGAVRFGHAYPVKDDQVYFPAPVSIVKEKDVNHFYDLAQAELDPKIQPKGGLDGLVRFHYDENADIFNAYTTSPDREIEYHHARPEDKRWLGHAQRGDGQFFQFEVLAPQQQFQAEIIGNYAHLKKFEELIAKTPTLFLGKSKTAQYGKCTLTATLAKLDETVNQLTWNNGEELVMTLASDMLLCNESGMMLPDPACFQTELSERLNVTKAQLKLEKTFLKTKQIGGFLGVWNMPKIQGTALAAGSVIVLRNNSGQDIDVTELQHAAFGLRTEEGFGRIKLNWHGKYHKIEKLKDHNTEQPNFALDLTTAKTLIVHIIEQRIQAALKSDARTKMKEIHAMPTNAFLGRLRLFLTSSTTFQAFQDKCSALKPRGREHLMKLDDVLFLHELAETQNAEKKISVDAQKFERVVNELKQVQKIRDWQYTILNNADIDFETMLRDHQFEWYQGYALQLLTILKLNNRK